MFINRFPQITQSPSGTVATKGEESHADDSIFFLKGSSEVAQKTPPLRENYWQLCCCLCSRVFQSKVISDPEELNSRVTSALQNNTDSYFFKYSPVGIGVCSANGEMLDCNPAYLAMTGFSKEDALGVNWLERISAENRTNFKSRNLKEKDTLYAEKQYEGVVNCKERPVKCGVILSTIHDSKTEKTFRMIQLEDLSRIQSAEETSINFIEEQKKTREAYVKGINHKFRTPIGQIAGLADLLKEEKISVAEAISLSGSIDSLTRDVIRELDDVLTYPEGEANKSRAHNITTPQVEKKSTPLSLESKIAAFKDKKVLVVDDSSMNRKLIGRILTDVGIQCEYFEDGTEVVARLQNVKKEDAKIDLVLMDLSMKVMGGIEATREIRKQHPNLPIIAVTGDGTSESVKKECKDNKMNAFCSKPYNKSAMFSRMHKLAIEGASGWVSDGE